MKTVLSLSILLFVCTGLASAGTIADAAAQPLGTEVTISDALILSITDLTPDTGYRSFQLRDVTRAITVYGTNAQIEAALTGWAAGDGINITGRTAALDGAIVLEPPVGGTVGGFAVSGRTSTAPFPFSTNALTVAPSDIAPPYESDLVCLQNVSFFDAGIFATETNYALAGVSALVRIAAADLGLAGQTIPAGLLNITGIVIADPAGDGYCLAPRGPGDIVPVPEPTSLLVLAVGGLILRKKRQRRRDER